MKVLFIRLSSIGDIVLTTPLIRCVYNQQKDVEIHYICKTSFVDILMPNVYLHRVHGFDKTDKKIFESLKSEHFDFVVDLQNNRHSRKICRYLNGKQHTFPKLNVKKWLLVNFKINLMPDLHVVDRYFEAVKDLQVINDGKGLDFFLAKNDYEAFQSLDLPPLYVAIAVGSKHFTKQLPKEVLLEICQKCRLPLVFLGDENDADTAHYLESRLKVKTYNLCGKLSIRMAAVCIKKSVCLLTGDTGLMHVAAALGQRIVSVWGNTVPAFGMYPYMPNQTEKYVIIENTHLKCRPCSKLGYKRCPHLHFNCMKSLSADEIVSYLNS